MSIRNNLVANYLGHGWSALMGIAFIPWYIRLLGIEAYGLIGVFALLHAWLALLDMGMTLALNREMARFTVGAHTEVAVRDLLRSVEILGAAVAVIVGIGLWLAAGWLAANWLRSETLPTGQVRDALRVMSLVVAFRFLEAIYHAAILGLQKQVWLNAATAALATLRWGGAVVVLLAADASIEAFFLWQSLVSAFSIAVLARALYLELPAGPRPARFSPAALAGLWHFAGGVMATTLLALLLTQVDKLVLSRLLSLQAFGYYSLATVVAGAIQHIVTPISQALYPRLTELATTSDKVRLVSLYHGGTQLVSVVVVPVALMLIVFGSPLLRLWTGDAELAARTAPLLALLALGTLLNGFMMIPYTLQLAYGWSNFAVRVNLVAVAFVVPAVLCVAPRYGAMGTAWVWVALNTGYLTIGTHFMHRKLLPEEKWRWYGSDIAVPALGACAAMIPAYFAHPASLPAYAEIAWLACSAAGSLAAAAFAASIPRHVMMQALHRLHSRKAPL